MATWRSVIVVAFVVEGWYFTLLLYNYGFLHATCAAMHWWYSGTMRCNVQLYFCFIFFNVQMNIHKLRGSDSIAIVLICNFRLQCGRGAAGPGAVQVRRRLWFVGRNVFVWKNYNCHVCVAVLWTQYMLQALQFGSLTVKSLAVSMP